MICAARWQLAQRCCYKGRAQEVGSPSRMRWVALGVLSLDICISYVPQYTFVPILRQSMSALRVDEPAMNILCILYALVYVPGAFVTGPLVSLLGCRWTFVVATGLVAAGCGVRCAAWSTEVPQSLTDGSDWPPNWGPAWFGNTAFVLLLAGQGLCALGQPLLVNCTSEMGSDWFMPSERPAAAMISNLMNFVGGSLSFVLPPLFVDDNPTDYTVMHGQIASLLSFQFHSAMLALVLTLVLYQPRPSAKVGDRQSMSFVAEVRSIVKSKDFWIVNFQFNIFIALCHAFDAVEGSLLENYGFNASLTSWTAISCGVTSILSTIVEARCITSARFYKVALVISNLFMATSLLAGYACLHYQMSPNVFVFAVGIMGLATPGWGCSAELGAEVCFPAREATVNGLLEAFSNTAGVVAIVWAQEGIDAHLGAAVLAVMAGAAFLGASVLYFLTGRLRRSEAEDSPKTSEAEDQESKLPKQEADRLVRKGRVMFLLWAILLNFVSVLLTATTAQFILPALLTEPLPMPAPKKEKDAKGRAKLKNGLKEPRTWALICEKRTSLNAKQVISTFANTSFAIFPCLRDKPDLLAAMNGLLPKSAQDVYARSAAARPELARAASHMKLWRLMVSRNIPSASVLEDTELPCPRFRFRRNELLGKLPLKTDFVAFNPRQEVGALDTKMTSAMRKRDAPEKFNATVFRLKPGRGIPEALNNYYVTLRWAKKMLRLGYGFDASHGSFSEHIFAGLYRSPQARGFRGYALKPAALAKEGEGQPPSC
ncbi:unnamed protein product [Effrenium voratum]|nr:unnamed protein product [Effrenium voratum]